MPEIFDQNHDRIGVLLSKEPNELHLFTFYAAPSIGLLLHQSKCALVHFCPKAKQYGKNYTNFQKTTLILEIGRILNLSWWEQSNALLSLQSISFYWHHLPVIPVVSPSCLFMGIIPLVPTTYNSINVTCLSFHWYNLPTVPLESLLIIPQVSPTLGNKIVLSAKGVTYFSG